MNEIKYSIRISPEVLKSDIVTETFSGDTGLDTFGLYTGMTSILSGDSGSSFLTGLTIPIMFTQTINDIGIYSEFDGDILQKDVVANFLYSANTQSPYDVYVYNTSGDFSISYLTFSKFYVDWGDGTNTQEISNQPLLHSYFNTPSDYTITFSGVNSWGTAIIQKEISLPQTGVTINNLEGKVTLIPQGGMWSGIPTSYDFIFTGDSKNDYQSQISSSYVNVPFIVSGFTKSRLIDLKRYGPESYTIGYQFFKNNELYGQVDEFNVDYTAYTINSVKYYDFVNGTTFYTMDSSGFTTNDLLLSKLTKNEMLLDFVFDPEVQSDVFIERGKYTAFEPLQRLGEVDNIGDLVRYGYNYYKINSV